MKRFVALTLAAAASCSAPSVSLTPYLAQYSLDGTIASTSSGATGSTSVGEDGLGIGDEESVFGGRVNFKGDHSHLSVSYSAISLSATGGRLSDDIQIGGETVDADIANVATDLDITTTSGLWTYDWNIGDTAYFGLGIGVTSLDFSAELTGTSDVAVATVTMDETLPIPLIAARLGGNIGPVRVEGTYAFLSVSVDDAEAVVSDLDISAGLKILGDTGSIVVGYRLFAFDAQFEDDSDSANLDLELGGPYAGVRIGF